VTPVIRTVKGDIEPDELGPCDAHEHLFLETPLQPNDTFQDVAAAVAEAQTLADAGGGALIDWTPLGLGRSAAGLLAVSKATQLHIVAATGLHRDAHYVQDDPFRRRSSAELAEQFTSEVSSGLDGTGARAGIIKVGASYHHLTAFEQTAFEAAAEAHAACGAAVCVHCEHGTMGLLLVQRLQTLGVAPERVVLAHLDRNPDPGEHAETAATGAWLQFDGPGRAKYHPDSTIIALIADLAERGHSDRLLLGGDTGRRSYMRAYGGGPGLDYLFARFKPRLERELGRDLSDQVFRMNPARAFAFEPQAGVGP
jgi:predicted metal-dependent phosphotriesterase family hydrolase